MLFVGIMCTLALCAIGRLQSEQHHDFEDVCACKKMII